MVTYGNMWAAFNLALGLKQMNFADIFAFGVIIIAIGSILSLPVIVWKWVRKEKAFPDGGFLGQTLGPREIRSLGIFCVVMICGFAQSSLSPESMFGQFIATSPGKMAYVALLVLIGSIIQYHLKSRKTMNRGE